MTAFESAILAAPWILIVAYLVVDIIGISASIRVEEEEMRMLEEEIAEMECEETLRHIGMEVEDDEA